MNRLARLTRFLVPPPCFLCGTPCVGGFGMCPHCATDFLGEVEREALRCPQCAIRVREQGQHCVECLNHPPHFDSAVAGHDFQAVSRHLIHRLKYGRDPGVLDALTHPLLTRLERSFSLGGEGWPDAVLPMPIHPERRRVRGFNQARLIADRLGRRFGLPVYGQAVTRTGSSQSQSGLTAIERRKSLRNAFEVKQTLPQHVAIVDDVMTTGSSADALARSLKRAGVSRVSVWVLARTPAPGDIPN